MRFVAAGFQLIRIVRSAGSITVLTGTAGIKGFTGHVAEQLAQSSIRAMSMAYRTGFLLSELVATTGPGVARDLFSQANPMLFGQFEIEQARMGLLGAEALDED